MEKNEMRIGIMGDTHGDTEAIRAVVRAAGPVELWFHTGDYSQDVRCLEGIVDVPIYSVCGNCDSYMDRAAVECLAKLEGSTIAMTHGHRLMGDYVKNLAVWGGFKKADIVIFGHTHVPLVQWEEGILLINPGSPSRPRRGLPSYGELYLKQGHKPVANICYLE